MFRGRRAAAPRVDAGGHALAVERLRDAWPRSSSTRIARAHREAMERFWAHTWHRRSWEAMRRYVQLDSGETAEAPKAKTFRSPLDDARWLIARDNGFTHLGRPDRSRPSITPPILTRRRPRRSACSRGRPRSCRRRSRGHRDWDAAVATIRSRGLPGLDANGQMTDDILERDLAPRARHCLASRRIEEPYRRRRALISSA